MDFTIVIPHRGNPLGLWATVHSCEQELENSARTYNYVIVTNGEKCSNEVKQTLENLSKTGKLKAHIDSEEPLTPPVARDRGAKEADGDYLFFLDNHCLVGRQYFDRALLDFEKFDIDLLHSTTKFYTGNDKFYEYRLKLDYNFWGEAKALALCDYKPYQIAMAGHGGIAVSRAVWEEVGGYGPEGVLRGYGGEEPMFDLKLGRYGKSVWIEPRMVHYHYTGDRGYARHYTDDYYTNMLVAANVIGGESWLFKVFESLVTRNHLKSHQANTKTNFELLETALERSTQYAAEVQSKSVMSLDELLIKYRTELVGL